MLQLMEGDKPLTLVQEGRRFKLPNGDYVAPARAGWSNPTYRLAVVPPPPPEPEPEAVHVPVISRMQAMVTLSEWGLTTQVGVLVRRLGAPFDIIYDTAAVWRRDSPTLINLLAEVKKGDGSSMTEEDLDLFFAQAEQVRA